MRELLFTCPTTGRMAKWLMVEFDSEPLDGLDAANCSGCGRTHIVLRQTGKPPIRQNVTMFEVSKTPRPRHDGIKRAS